MANGDALEDQTSMTSTTMTSAHNLIQQAEKMKSELNFFKDKFSEPSKVDLENTFTEGCIIISMLYRPLLHFHKNNYNFFFALYIKYFF